VNVDATNKGEADVEGADVDEVDEVDAEVAVMLLLLPLL